MIEGYYCKRHPLIVYTSRWMFIAHIIAEHFEGIARIDVALPEMQDNIVQVIKKEVCDQ